VIDIVHLPSQSHAPRPFSILATNRIGAIETMRPLEMEAAFFVPAKKVNCLDKRNRLKYNQNHEKKSHRTVWSNHNVEKETMSTKRVFKEEVTEKKAEDYHGGCRYRRTLPDVASSGVKSVNIEVPLEEALKLSLALQSCLLSLNKISRKDKIGKRMGVVLSVKTENETIVVLEKKLAAEDDD